MKHILSLSTFALCLLGLSRESLHAQSFELKETKDGVDVLLDDDLFTRYLVKSGAKPILWPVVGPDGAEMTRGYPMREATATEASDHHHHRSFWFTHGDVNGVSFWHEQGDNGNIEHREFLKLRGGRDAMIQSCNDWVAPDGTKLCEDTRTLTFGANSKFRWIDFDITLAAVEEVTFGDTKEGSFGLRVAGTMRVDLKPGGTILNSEDQSDKGAWGKPAAWVDYSGPVGDTVAGIAILNHPHSFRYPTHWHVRTYGLFAANPFGLGDFYGDKENYDGSHHLNKGESFSLYYRVIFHAGNAEQAQIAQEFEKYAAIVKDN